MSDQRIRFESPRGPWRGLALDAQSARVPLGAPPAWLPVVAAADWRCECTGACGRRHSRSEFRCDREHGRAGVRLMVAPADLMLTLAQAAEVEADDLHAWCPECHRLARRRQTEGARQRARLAAEPGPTLF